MSLIFDGAESFNMQENAPWYMYIEEETTYWLHQNKKEKKQKTKKIKTKEKVMPPH